MQIALGDNKIKALMIHNDTSDATLKASDMQAGVTGYANGQKLTGTGKAFAFAMYGNVSSTDMITLPVDTINTIIISSAVNPVKMAADAVTLRSYDFSTDKQVATVTVNGTDYPITMRIAGGILTFGCSQKVTLQVFIGKDEYV